MNKNVSSIAILLIIFNYKKILTVDNIQQPWVSLFQMQTLAVANKHVSPMLHYDKEFYVVRWPIAPIFSIHVDTESSTTISLQIQHEFWVGNKLIEWWLSLSVVGQL